jgi:hypothetical protein
MTVAVHARRGPARTLPAMARKKRTGAGRVAQLKTAYTMTRKVDSKVGLVIGGVALAVFLVVLLVGLLAGHPFYAAFLGLLLALLAATITFGKRAERAAYSSIHGQTGAAAGVLQSMRGKWTVTPAVAVTRNQDVVHRVVGAPGIVLVAEGAATRVGGLIAAEKKKMARFVPDAPVYDLVAGDADGQVPLRKLQARVARLPRNLRPAEVSEVNRRLKAVGGLNVPIPKGPVPRGGRMPRTPRAR